jgi:comEA protein
MFIQYAPSMDDGDLPMVNQSRKSPAVWAAVGVLGGAAMVGLAWAVWPSPSLAMLDKPAPVPVATPALPPTIIVNVPPPVVPVATEIGGEPLAAGPAALASTVVTPAAEKPAPEPAAEDTRQAKTLTTKINLNTATAEELDLLPGVGKATALAIIEYRTKHGKFRTISELDKVSGIGPSKLEKLRPLVTVD